jgi:predicted esterase
MSTDGPDAAPVAPEVRRGAREHHLTVERTARYCTLGEPGDRVREVWFACHGYGQLAHYFIRHFAALDDGTRLIVAPEALSRFYVTGSSTEPHAGARVGASWMTREDRAAEINDYVDLLDAVHDRVFEQVDRRAVTVTVLGFSQGVATAGRWVEHGRVRADHLIAWAGALPNDAALAASDSPLRRVRLTTVVGADDEMATDAAMTAEHTRLGASGLTPRIVRFDGGHRMDARTLLAIATEQSIVRAPAGIGFGADEQRL